MPGTKTFQYKGRELVLERKYFDEYVQKTGIELNKVYTIEETTEIINANVISLYQGKCRYPNSATGEEICICLSDIKETFNLCWDIELENDE